MSKISLLRIREQYSLKLRAIAEAAQLDYQLVFVTLPAGSHLKSLWKLVTISPPLVSPAGGRQLPGGGGSNSESAHRDATLELESDIALPVLASHYARQLEQAGWQRTGEGSSEPMAWHTWEFRDPKNEHWRGVFTLLQIPGMVRTYSLHILINWDGTT